MERTDELKERIRQQPLNDRLEESRRRIGDMCSKGRCPKMTIPVQHDDDDFYINTTLADAQATIAALQARAEQAERLVASQAQEIMQRRQTLGDLAQLHQEQSKQLTQRTAELEEANHTASTHQALWREACDQRDKAQAELERVRGERDEANELVAALSSKVAEYEVELNGDPQNFYGRGRTVGLRTLIAALPKVEGAVVVSNGYVKDSTRCHALFGADEDAALYAALLQHRQGMEG